MQLQEVETIIPYDQLMTPKWIESNAEITGNHQLTEAYYEILPTTGETYQRALRVPLLPPKILSSNDSITIVMIVAMDTTIAITDDHDATFGISDEKSFIGFQAVDVGNYHNYAPCFSVNADVGIAAIENIKLGDGPLTSSTHFPSVIKIQLKPAEKWGSCETPQGDGGYNNLGFYESTLDPSNGLYFEFYRHHANEEYHIKYIQVDVQWD